ncbi:MAG: nicotinamide-nucleotide amidohydrolase family protein [Desulfovibrio sp.]|nr:nicotinamide-nucleotide amidohydrolase family protein [Desulfovibrio sp.]
MEKVWYPEDVLEQARSLGRALEARSLRLAVAESCTGGLVAALCTETPGSSVWFAGGVVAYANQVKENLLDVPGDLLASAGAVSEPVVRRMARGAISALGARVGLAISGLAGPGGGSPEKPVGLVWMAAALAGADGEVRVVAGKSVFPGDRGQIRLAAAGAVLALARELL